MQIKTNGALLTRFIKSKKSNHSYNLNWRKRITAKLQTNNYPGTNIGKIRTNEKHAN